MASDDVILRIGVSTDPLTAGLASAKSAVSSFQSSVTSSLAGLGSSFNGVTSAIEGITSALGAGAIGGALAGIVAGVEKLSARATEMRTMADTIGASVEQFQAMSATADAAGVSMNIFARAQEKLTVLLDDARDHSGPAIGKLRDLGVSLEQINDPAFTVNDLLGVLKERLTNASTAQNEHNLLLKEFGGRLAEAITLIERYDGSKKGVAKTDAEVNALTDVQTKRLTEISAWWKTLGTEIANTTSKYLIFLAAKPTDSGVGKAGLLGSPTQAGDLAGNQQQGTSGQADGQKALAEAAKQTQEVVVSASHVSTESQLKDLHELVSETQAGTAARVAAASRYYTESLQFLGKDADTTRAAHTALLTDERELSSKRTSFLEQWAAEYQRITSQNAIAVMEMDTRLAKEDNAAAAERERQLEELSNFAEQLDLQVTREHIQSLKELAKANADYEKEQLVQWKEIGKAIEAPMAASFTKILEGTQRLSTTMRQLFVGVADAIAQAFAKQAATNISQMLMQAAVGKAIRAKEIEGDAETAAAGAYKAVVGIPYAGPFLAPAAAAVAFGAVMAFDTAQGGYDIPGTINPLIQAHGGEMVLPRDIADRFRSASGDGGGRGDNVSHNYNIMAHDARGLESFLRSPSGKKLLTETLTSAYRRGTRGTRR
jgi:hypothetical protein